MEDLMKRIEEAYKIKEEIEKINQEIKSLEEKKKVLENQYEEINPSLLDWMITSNTKEVETEDHIFLNYFTRTEFTYGDEKALLKYLQDNKLNDYINSKTTTTISINKNALKKDLKEKPELKESLKDYVGDKTTNYIVITNEENHQKLFEHIEGGK